MTKTKWNPTGAFTTTRVLATLAAAVIAASPTQAANLFWDSDADASAATGGTGPWDGASSLWRLTTDTGALQPWNNVVGNADTAVLGGTAGTLTLSGTIFAKGVTFATDGYFVSGGTLTPAGTITLTANNGVTGTLTSLSSAAGFSQGGTAAANAGTVILANAGGASVTGGQISLGAGGTIKLGAASQIAAAATIKAFANGAASSTFDINGFATTIAGLTDTTVTDGATTSNGYNLTNSSATAATFAMSNTSGSGTNFSGVISGNLNFTQGTRGTFTLRGTQANTFTGLTSVTGTNGVIAMNKPAGVNAIGGNLSIGTQSGVTLNNNEQIPDTASVTMALNGNVGRTFNVNGKTETIGSLASTGTFTEGASAGASGNTVALGAGTLITGDGTTTAYNGIITGVGGNLTKQGAGTFTLGGSAATANTYTGLTSVTGGVLALNKTAGTNAVAGNLSVSGAEVRLVAADQIADASAQTLTAGTFNTDGFGETAGTLTVAAGASTIDLGAAASVLSFADSSALAWAGTLSVIDWTGLEIGGGSDQLRFGTSAAALTAGQLAAIRFVNPDGFDPGTYGAGILATGEVIPVPEPVALAFVGLGGFALARRRWTRAV